MKCSRRKIREKGFKVFKKERKKGIRQSLTWIRANVLDKENTDVEKHINNL